jgi:4-hydroxybenzoate polyprenyltransferase/phosphoserine phosphatase
MRDARLRGEVVLSKEPVLVIDMDGTLTRSDTLHEAFLALLAADVRRAAALFAWLRAGKAAFKRRLADLQLADAATLPLDEDVMALLRDARANGRRTALVSAADQRQVDALAARVGLFDEAHGTGGAATGPDNLSGDAKAAFLTARYGARGFDYVGDSRADLPVWAAARRAVTVGACGSLRAAAERVAAAAQHLRPASGGLRRFLPCLQALRPHQWSKNLLIFAPMLAAHDFSAAPSAVAAFVAFCLTASSVYVINDMLDLKADRNHPRKRSRPFAAGTVSLAWGMAAAPTLALSALAIALLFTPPLFAGVLTLYYIVTFAYSLWLKRQVMVDILTLACLYTLRIFAGAAATDLPLSPWLLAFAMFMFLALAAVKRQAELTDQLREGRIKVEGRGYTTDDLPIMRGIALSAGYASVMVFALYINSPNIIELYSQPEMLWLVCPLLLYWVSYMVMATHRGRMTADPIVYAATDPVSQVVVGVAGAVIIAGSLM